MDMAVASFQPRSSTSTSFLRPISAAPPPPPPPSTRLRDGRICCVRRCCRTRSSLKDKTLVDIQNSGVIACLRAQSAELALEAAEAALNGGITVVIGDSGFYPRGELFDYENALPLQAGTVLNAKDAKSAVDAGAKFLMSPAIVMEILDDVQGSEYLYIPGAMTPTEILSAYKAGARIVKVYPISELGGIQYIATLQKPFSHIPMVASQGITIDSVGEYIAQGASSVVLSDAIFDKEAMAQRNFGAVSQLAQLAALLGNEAVERKRCKVV